MEYYIVTLLLSSVTYTVDLEVLLKALGITYISSLAEDYCRDCGENAIASQVDLIGRLGMISVSLPLFTAVAEVVRSLLE